MSKAASPLRYPGGKSSLFDLVRRVMAENRFRHREYAEPFAGGCGLALSILYSRFVTDIHINDVDPAIWAFWHSVLDHADEFIDRIESTPVTIEEWERQKEVQATPANFTLIDLGFSAFFLNRTNRSGIIKRAGAIGGRDQKGNYKIDCRFNKDELVRRIRRIGVYRDQIHLTRLDALEFLENRSGDIAEDAFFCIDPPYFHKGSRLYTSYYDPSDHGVLAEKICSLEAPWIVTYDDAAEIRRLYRGYRQFIFDINYSLQTKRVGNEILIASKGLRIPSEMRDRQINRVRQASLMTKC